MSQYLNEKVIILADAGKIFAKEIETQGVKLDNYQSAKVCIKTGAGDKTTTNAKVVAILPDASEVEIKSEEITIGNLTETIINVVANELAHYDATEFKIKIDAIEGSTILGSITAILGEPRFSE